MVNLLPILFQVLKILLPILFKEKDNYEAIQIDNDDDLVSAWVNADRL